METNIWEFNRKWIIFTPSQQRALDELQKILHSFNFFWTDSREAVNHLNERIRDHYCHNWRQKSRVSETIEENAPRHVILHSLMANQWSLQKMSLPWALLTLEKTVVIDLFESSDLGSVRGKNAQLHHTFKRMYFSTRVEILSVVLEKFNKIQDYCQLC